MRRLLLPLCLVLAAAPAGAADGTPRDFDIPAGEALVALKQFVAQSGAQLIYSAEEVEGVTTKSARGRFPAVTALERMFQGTPLVAARDDRTGGLSVRRTGTPLNSGAGRAGTLSGVVSNVRTGKFLEGVLVRIAALDRQTLTNGRGQFVFSNLPAGAYEVEASYIGLNTASRPVEIRAYAERITLRRDGRIADAHRHCSDGIRRFSTRDTLRNAVRETRSQLPYLLRNLTIDRPNQVWCADITYVPMAQGFLYLVVIMDWASRCVLAWRLSNTLDRSFCVAALEEALTKGKSEIFNTDQGVQFTSTAFTDVLSAAGIAISMDGCGRWMDNVFVERLWRSLKYEEIHLRDYASALEARMGIGQWITFYNQKRGHMAFSYRTPEALWATGAPIAQPPKRKRARPACGHVDNASALPTCPQAQQQQKRAA